MIGKNKDNNQKNQDSGDQEPRDENRNAQDEGVNTNGAEHQHQSGEVNEQVEPDQQQSEQQQDKVYSADELENIDDPDTLRDMIEEKQEKISELEEQVNENSDALLRKVAELENVRKRFKREKEQIHESAKIKALEKFLPINDDLKRTLEASENLDVNQQFLDGVKMVSQKFDEVLEEYEVERIDQTMVPFDVDYHDAMMKQPADDENVESNTVLQVMESGYKMGDRVIRHAKVVVSE